MLVIVAVIVPNALVAPFQIDAPDLLVAEGCL